MRTEQVVQEYAGEKGAVDEEHQLEDQVVLVEDSGAEDEL